MSQPHPVKVAEQAVREFFQQWIAGLQPSLLLQTKTDGEILLSSRVTTGVPQPAEQIVQDRVQRKHHRVGPSQLRRRARRAQARGKVAEQAAAAPSLPQQPPCVAGTAAAAKSLDASVQASQIHPVTVNIAVQAVPQTPQLVDTAVQVGDAQHKHHQHATRRVIDQFCPDQEQAEQAFPSPIPQLDGGYMGRSRNQFKSPDTPQCKDCHKVFETRDDFKWHCENKHGREDCRILKSMLTFQPS